jgi:membrane protein
LNPRVEAARAFLQRARRSPRDAIRTFLGETIWQWDLSRMSRLERWGALLLRMIYLVGRGFVSARAQTQAMALTYTTMLALVPAFAIMVAVFSMRGLKEARVRLETFIVDALAFSNDQGRILSQKLNELVQNLQGGGGVAGLAFLVFLFLTVVALLSTLEKTLNDVWGVKRNRSFIQKFVTYWCIATLGPLSLGTALVQGSSLWQRVYDAGRTAVRGNAPDPVPVPIADLGPGFGLPGVTGALFDQLEASRADGPKGEVSLDYILTGTELASDQPGGFSFPAFGLTVVTFAILYAFLPNTRVKLTPAFMGALCATLLWVGTKWLLAKSSSTLVKYDTLYGSLATIPITMFWLYLSWLIVILGAEMTFALQNVKSQRKEELATDTNELCRELVALRLVAAIAHAYEHGAAPPSKEALAERLGAPHALCAAILHHLVEDHVLRDVDTPDDRGYVPARPIDRITISCVIDSLRERLGIAFDLAWGDDLPILTHHLGQANAASKALASRVTLRHVVDALEEKDREASLSRDASVDPAAAAVSVLTSRAIAIASGLSASGLRGDSGRLDAAPLASLRRSAPAPAAAPANGDHAAAAEAPAAPAPPAPSSSSSVQTPVG